MLRIIRLTSPTSKKSIWEKFDPRNEIWVVSDLQSKILLLNQLLKTRDILGGEPVVRAAELWRFLMKQSAPDFVSVGEVGSWALAKKYLSNKKDILWTTRPRAASTLLDFCSDLTSLITHEYALDVLTDLESMFQSQSSLFESMARAAVEFYEFCLLQKRIPHFFLPALLLRYAEKLPTQRKYVFDMDAKLWESEKDLIQNLSKNNEVSVLIPDHKSYQKKTYENLSLGAAHSEESQVGEKGERARIEVWRCSSFDAEARKTVEKISQWIKEGVKPSDICVAAQDVSLYENILEHDLNWEGLSLNKNLSSPLSSHAFYRQLHAQLKILSGDWNSEVLYEAFPGLTPAEKRLLKPAMSLEQICVPWVRQKVEEIAKLWDGSQEIPYKDFEKLIITLKKQIKIQGSPERILLKLKDEVGSDIFDFSIWLEAWQKIVARTDLTYKGADEHGIYAVNFHSSREVQAKKVIVLGVNSPAPQKDYSALLSKEARNFLFDTGFNLDRERYDWTEDLDWLLSDGKEEAVLSTSVSDQGGKAQSPHPYWIKIAKSVGKASEFCDHTENTVWCGVQDHIAEPEVRQTLETLKNWPSNRATEIFFNIENEMKRTRPINVEVSNLKFSPSGLEKLWACPFKFLVGQGFHLEEDADLEVEPTPQVRGQVLHSAIDKIVSAGFDFWAEEKLINLLDECAKNQKQATSDVWPSTRKKLLRQLLSFIDFEKKWRGTLPVSFASYNELEVKGFLHWDKENSQLDFLKNSPPGKGWVFRGRIDRVDLDTNGGGVVIDYKDRGSQLGNIKSWLNQGQFQLALYAQALEKGLSQIPIRKVVGAFYYSLRSMDRSRGMACLDSEPTFLLSKNISKNALVTGEERAKYFTEINGALGQALECVKKGEFTPSPHGGDLTICDKCSWKIICRHHQLL